MATLFTLPFADVGQGIVPSDGAKLYFYAFGTSTPKDTYTTSALSTPNSNPVEADADGLFPAIWLSGMYSATLKDKNGVQIWSAPEVNEDTAYSIQYIPPQTGGVSRTVNSKLSDLVSVKDFGATGNGSTDDSAALQLAIDSGASLYFPEGSYKCANLTQSTTGQRFYALGNVKIIKNANGPILTASGSYLEFNGLSFYGGDSSATTYTGNNLTVTGNHPVFINCSSQWAVGRALLATGAHVQIIGTNGIYQTTDATATGYDIEIGVSGTVTLYHQLYGIYTSQSTGGIKFIDAGSQSIVGGQIGKLYIAKGTGPAGSNGGMVTNTRITGNVTVELSSANFTGVQFSSSATTITLAAGTSGCSIDASNSTAFAYVNNGNANNLIQRKTSAGGVVGWTYGDSTWVGETTVDSSGNYTFGGSIQIPNAASFKALDSTASLISMLNLSAGDDIIIGANNGANYCAVNSGSVGVFLGVGGSSIIQCKSTTLMPVADGTINLGAVANRYATVYATTGAINTSDARSKQQISSLSECERAAAVDLKSALRKYKLNDAVDKKSDAARIHMGIIAQDVVDIFSKHGLDAHQYALLCYDKWESSPAIMNGDDIISAAVEAGDRYGIRYDELLAFIISAM